MKFQLVPLFGLFLLMACSDPANPKIEADTTEAPTLWVDYKSPEGIRKNKRIILVSGDEEYRSEEMLPQLAAILAQRHGFDCQVLFAQNPAQPGVIQPNYSKNIPGLEALAQADLLILFTRFRALPDEQMEYLSSYLLAGKPIIGIRTATHAFEFKDSSSRWHPWSNSYQNEDSPWHNGFGRLVLGEKWHTHHGHHKHQSTRGLLAPEAVEHPIARGLVGTPIWGPTDVYGVRLPLPDDAMPIVMGQVIERSDTFAQADLFFGMRPTDQTIATSNPANKGDYHPNEPMMPIAWTKSYQLPKGQQGKAFCSTIGASTDLLNPGVRRLLVNASYHLAELEVPDSAKVELVGNYQPSAYSFHSDDYWKKKNLLIKDLIPNK